MTYQSTTASETLVRIGALQREIVEASAKGFGSAYTVMLIGELKDQIELLEREAVAEHLGVMA